MEPISVIILAAGLGSRMGSEAPKVLAKTRERTLIEHVLNTASALSPEKIVVVTGHKRELVEEQVAVSAENNTYNLDEVTFAYQKEQLGTGHAVKCALEELGEFRGTVVVLYGDTPLLKPTTIEELLKVHRNAKATVSLVSLTGHSNNGYGRIIRAADGRLEKIVELKDCNPTERLVDETNSGIYAVDSAFIGPAVKELTNHNVQGEYYLTDIIERAVTEGQGVEALIVFDDSEIQGVNTQSDLIAINEILLRRKVEELVASGVTVLDPKTFYIDSSVTVEPGAQIGPVVTLKGDTTIGSNTIIEGSTYIVDSKIGSECTLKHSLRIENAQVGRNTSVGPFAHLRPGTELGEDCRIGNFVETKKAKLHDGAKASHLSYVGDATVHSGVNIGAGTITANYDGYNKHHTTIEAEASIGSNSVLVAPVTIGAGSYVGAGSVITKNVEADSLALTRGKLKAKSGWNKVRREMLEKKS